MPQSLLLAALATIGAATIGLHLAGPVGAGIAALLAIVALGALL